ncbi:voltage-gated ion channel superfamily, partial [Chrysochromulina tobinii]
MVPAGSINVIADWFSEQGQKRFIAQQRVVLENSHRVAAVLKGTGTVVGTVEEEGTRQTPVARQRERSSIAVACDAASSWASSCFEPILRRLPDMKFLGRLQALRLAFVFFCLCIILGEVENYQIEGCGGFGAGWSCGGNVGCDAWKLSHENGGYCWSWVDEFYFGIITYLTIGYGDVHPHTKGGKLLAAFLVVFGVLSFSTLLTEINVMVRFGADKTLRQRLVDLREVIEQDDNHTVTRGEFIFFNLKKMGKVDEDIIHLLKEQFKALDMDSSGELDANDIAKLSASANQLRQHLNLLNNIASTGANRKTHDVRPYGHRLGGGDGLLLRNATTGTVLSGVTSRVCLDLVITGDIVTYESVGALQAAIIRGDLGPDACALPDSLLGPDDAYMILKNGRKVFTPEAAQAFYDRNYPSTSGRRTDGRVLAVPVAPAPDARLHRTRGATSGSAASVSHRDSRNRPSTGDRPPPITPAKGPAAAPVLPPRKLFEPPSEMDGFSALDAQADCLQCVGATVHQHRLDRATGTATLPAHIKVAGKRSAPLNHDGHAAAAASTGAALAASCNPDDRPAADTTTSIDDRSGEMRLDAANGKPYTFDAFVDYYGERAFEAWDAATPAAVIATSPQRSSSPPRPLREEPPLPASPNKRTARPARTPTPSSPPKAAALPATVAEVLKMTEAEVLAMEVAPPLPSSWEDDELSADEDLDTGCPRVLATRHRHDASADRRDASADRRDAFADASPPRSPSRK